jgi:hypothetical protein
LWFSSTNRVFSNSEVTAVPDSDPIEVALRELELADTNAVTAMTALGYALMSVVTAPPIILWTRPYNGTTYTALLTQYHADYVNDVIDAAQSPDDVQTGLSNLSNFIGQAIGNDVLVPLCNALTSAPPQPQASVRKSAVPAINQPVKLGCCTSPGRPSKPGLSSNQCTAYGSQWTWTQTIDGDCKDVTPP